MHTYLTLLAFIFLNSFCLKAQTLKFISSGKIEYERKIKNSALYATDSEILNDLEKNGQKFKRNFFSLTFNLSKTVYKPSKETPENFKFQKMSGDDNIIFTDLEKKISISQKHIYENPLLIFDSTRKIQWKITAEKRQIIGFECRRANAIIMDSVYIVAYFSEEILTEGGPESFSGLPGMILGVAMPYEHITWFATKLTLTQKDDVIDKPVIGETISNLALKEMIKKYFDINTKLGAWQYKFSLL
jgi:GLPGLI family protein